MFLPYAKIQNGFTWHEGQLHIDSSHLRAFVWIYCSEHGGVSGSVSFDGASSGNNYNGQKRRHYEYI